MKRSAILFILLFLTARVLAQTDSSGFYVQSFKKLEWDLDARSNHPMLDQNNRKAALIKVVIPEDGFDFDVGVMGVVGVRQEHGEVWVYVPEGVRKITIRHQTYGVIRDYEFGCPIESASVYEMRLHVPLRPKATVVVKDSVIVRDSIVYVPTPVYTRAPRKRVNAIHKGVKAPRERKWLEVSKQTKWSTIAFTKVPDPSIGLMTVWHARKFGAYIKAEGMLKRSSVDYNVFESDYINKDVIDGRITDNSVIWNGHFTRLSISAGTVFRCTDWLGICCGIGYGQYLFRYDGYCVHYGNSNSIVQSKDYYDLTKGVSLDLGEAVMHFGHFSAFLGCNALIDGTYFQKATWKWLSFEFGIGYSF